MLRLENFLLLILIIICALVSFTLVESVIGEVNIGGMMLAAITHDGLERDVFSDEYSPSDDEGINEDFSFQSGENGWEKFRNEGYAFEISYPAIVEPNTIPNQKSLNTGLDVQTGTPVWEFELTDPVYFEATNLVRASLVIQVTHGNTAVTACTEYKQGSEFQLAGESLPNVRINQIDFLMDRVNEGVMGGFYQLTSYRTLFQEACYELTKLVKINNQENFPENSIQSFNHEVVDENLDRILDTFHFLNVEATFPDLHYPDMKSVDEVVDKSIGGYSEGIDVSHWQGDIGWIKVYNSGIRFAFVKGTEGVGWTDSLFLHHMAEGENAGVYLGVYHFARPDLGNSGREEAEYFLSVAGDYLESGYLRPVLDLEVRGNMSQNALSAWVLEWLQTVESQSGIAPLIYTNLYYINTYLTNAVTEYDLWIAYWNCDPTVTSSIPPTGRWDEWAFWQYCVGSPGTVPGVNTNIDLDIYNGNDGSLGDYDAASPLWVSIISDTNQAPAPYYADLTVDVNGDATGLINYHIWWNCSSLESDIAVVEGVCGELPDPSSGQCVQDGTGMRCLDISSDTQLAEYTYTEITDITAKVIVERNGLSPVEDRYQIMTTNPIKLIDAIPASPGTGEIGEDYIVDIDVTTDTSIAGILQVEIVDFNTSLIIDSDCISVPGDTTTISNFSMTIPWSISGLTDYEIWGRYRPGLSCPIVAADSSDLVEQYSIEWPIHDIDKIGLYNPEISVYSLKPENTAGWEGVNWFRFGPEDGGQLPIDGDWDGDGYDTVGYFDPVTSKFYLKPENTSGWDGVNLFKFGPAGGGRLPIVGDWDGDGIDTIGLFDPATSSFSLKPENTIGWDAVNWFIFGPANENNNPLVGDWNGDGVDTIGLFDPETSIFYLKPENSSGWDDVNLFKFGPEDANYYPLAGDWDGDGVDTVGLFDPATSKFYLKPENIIGWEGVIIFKFGPEGGERIPIIGKWD